MANDNQSLRSSSDIVAMALSIGLLGGVVFGLLVLDNIGFGVALGLGVGGTVAGIVTARRGNGNDLGS